MVSAAQPSPPAFLPCPGREVFCLAPRAGGPEHKRWAKGKAEAQRYTLIKGKRSWNAALFGRAAIHLRDTRLPAAAFKTLQSLRAPRAGSLHPSCACPAGSLRSERRPHAGRQRSEERCQEGGEEQDRRDKGWGRGSFTPQGPARCCHTDAGPAGTFAAR